MANYGGAGSGHTGPYWRRQNHTTLPGERTGQQLAALNALRARMGLDPEGGPEQHHAIQASLSQSRPGRSDFGPMPGEGPGGIMTPGLPDEGLVQLPHPIDNTGGLPAYPGSDLGDLRSQLLQQFQQHTAVPAGSGDPRQQLIQRLLQRQLRVARPVSHGRSAVPAHQVARPGVPLRPAYPA